MDTTLLDKMFPESPSDEYLELCEKVLFALRASGTEYEVQAWEDASSYVIQYPEYAEWANHFMKVASMINRRKSKKEK